jgi:hypothetical protein
MLQIIYKAGLNSVYAPELDLTYYRYLLQRLVASMVEKGNQIHLSKKNMHTYYLIKSTE